MTVSDEQHAAFLARVKADRVATGLPETIDDADTLRMIAAVIASSKRRLDVTEGQTG